MRTAEENKRAGVTYDMAYFFLPSRAHAGLEELKAELDESPEVGALSYYVSAAKRRGVRPHADDMRAIRVYSGRLVHERDFIVIEYPRFFAVDLLADFSGGLPAGAGPYVLAPYFSAIVEDRGTREADYFVLGQSPDARTTLRSVSPTMNANLGPGCEPELEAFLKLLRERFAES